MDIESSNNNNYNNNNNNNNNVNNNKHEIYEDSIDHNNIIIDPIINNNSSSNHNNNNTNNNIDVATLTYSPHDDVPHLKAVLVGDTNVGKTFLLIRFTNAFPHNGYYSAKLEVNGKMNQLLLFDMKLNMEPENLEPPLTYSQVDIFIICFSLVDPNSLLNAVKWCNVLSPSRTPYILVGTKCDMRDIIPKGIPHVTPEQGAIFTKKIGAAEYIECSSTAQIGIRNVFERAVVVTSERYAKKMRKKQKRFCIIL